MGEKIFAELDEIQALINSEKEMYKKAIKADKKFKEVKVIYLNIKKLQKKADALMQNANELHKNNGKKAEVNQITSFPKHLK